MLKTVIVKSLSSNFYKASITLIKALCHVSKYQCVNHKTLGGIYG